MQWYFFSRFYYKFVLSQFVTQPTRYSTTSQDGSILFTTIVKILLISLGMAGGGQRFATYFWVTGNF